MSDEEKHPLTKMLEWVEALEARERARPRFELSEDGKSFIWRRRLPVEPVKPKPET